MSPRARRGVCLVLLAAAWASAGAAPLREARDGARAPIDFARDYVAAHARVHLGRGAAPVDEAGNAYAAAVGAPRVELLGGPYYIHPPTAMLPVLPLVPLGFDGAALAWGALSLAALGALALLLVSLVEDRAPRRAHALALFVLLLAWPPVLHNLAKGQWSILLAASIAMGFWALERGRPRSAGVWLGVAASLKATPILLLGFLALRHRRAAAAMLVTLAVAILASVAVGGLAPWHAWLAESSRNVDAWQTWTANTVSLAGVLARLLAGGPFARPLVAAPGLCRALTVGLSLALVAGVALVTQRAAPSPRADRRLFAAWVALVVLLNPLGWSHTATLALVPLALLVDDAPGAAAVILVALSIPRQTLAALAGAVPVAPAPGLALSVHAVAVAALVLVAARAALTTRTER